jgi:hypothetical protein
MTSGVAAVVLIVAVFAIQPQRPPPIEFATAAMPSLEENYAEAHLNRLSDQDIEDQSLIYPTEAKR